MKTRHSILPLIALMIMSVAQAAGLTGRGTTQKVKNRADGDTRYATVEVTPIQKSGHKRVRKVESWTMGEGKGTKKIVFFTYPGDVKGTGFLTQDYGNPSKTDDRWLYLPAMKKTRRISGESLKTDYFMGDDFTYDDIGTRSVNEETHTLLREEVVSGRKCWVVQSVPKDKEEVCSKRITWIRQDCLMAVKADYYDKLNKLYHSLTISNTDKVQRFWMMHLVQMEDVQTGHKTIIKMDNQGFNVKIAPNLFTVSKLEKGL